VGEKCTALHGVPTHFLGILDEIERRQAAGDAVDLRRLRYVLNGLTSIKMTISVNRTGIVAGSPVPIDLMKILIEKLNLKDLTVAYGMSTLVTFFSELLFVFDSEQLKLRRALCRFNLRLQTLSPSELRRLAKFYLM